MIVAAFFIIACAAWGVAQGTFGVFVPVLAEEMGWSRTKVSAAFSINVLTFSLFGIFWGWLSDRWSVKGVVAITASLAGLGIFLSGTTEALWQLYLYYGVIFGVSLGGLVGPLTGLASRWFGPRTGLAIGISFAGIGVGTAVLPLLAEYLISASGWRFGFQGLSYVMWGAFLVGVLVLREPRSEELDTARGGVERTPGVSKRTYGPQAAEPATPLSTALRTRPFWVMLGMMVIGDMVLFMVLVHLVARATDVGIGSEAAATLLTVTGVSKMAGLAGGGGLGDRYGHRIVYSLSLLLLAASMIWLMGSSRLWMLYIFAMAFGLGNGGWSPQIPALASRIYGSRHLGAIFGAIILGVGIGGVSGPILAGYVFDSTGSYNIAFSVGAGMALVGAGLPFLITEKRRRSPIVAAEAAGDGGD